MKKCIFFTLVTLATSAAYAEDLSKYQEESRAVVMPFLKQLATENQKAISEGGPESAIKVCKDIAPKMAGDISRQNGWKLSRVSLKVRNPLLGTPDAWEQKNLQEFTALAAKGEKAETMEVAEIVQEPAGKSFRFMKAIAMKPGCIACHGNAEQIPANIKARLSEEYPHDKATGYSVGQIIGAVSVKRPI
ncbi:MAG: Protein of unknown function (DUF3365) [Candidatus Nitrotoga sp. CP45]|nr:MAG: Protein of unknown function (DUF3365) [Candidatus Nitrotoga sp. CP45]